MSIIFNGIELNNQKVKSLLSKIILLAKTNVSTKNKNDFQMVTAIMKMIEEEVECF